MDTSNGSTRALKPYLSEPFEIYAWNHDGTPVPGFPVRACGIVKGTPALGDLDNDRTVEIIVDAYHHSDYDTLYVWESHGKGKNFRILLSF